MASDHSFDIVCQFDLQELKNALDQVKREISTRYDFKGVTAEVTLNENDITVIAPDTMKLKAVQDMLFQKLINRKLSPKILEMKEPEPAAGGTLRQVYTLKKVLDTATCKLISQIIKENYQPNKAKANIQGESVRVVSKDIDTLQEIMTLLKKREDIVSPLQFTNYR